MLEVYYEAPENPKREAVLTQSVAALGGRLDFRESPSGHQAGMVCLTYEFGDMEGARAAADALRRQGVHVEGPSDYGSPNRPD
jgi:hypothetical protein